uniref:Ground-like domain-containing protein n=1 Tax=Plectus sambesii TaxID=2011161 RepID=A0A914W9M1_9BILA
MKSFLLLGAVLMAMFAVGEGCGWGIPSVPVSCGCSAPAWRNSCCGGSTCGGCYTRRRFTTRRVTRDVTHEYTTISDTGDDPVCNSEPLRLILKKNMSNDTSTSKEDIHREAEEKLGGHYAVICSTGHFDYIADSRHYCQLGNDQITCYAFQL